MLIAKAGRDTDALSDKVILITGAGGGIGFEAARALAYLGAKVIIAEIDKNKGEQAQSMINHELQSNRASFFAIDIAEEKQIDSLYAFIKYEYGHLDVIINNATVTPMGAVDTVSIVEWDKSYAVNLKAPILLAQKFLPDMKARNSGILVFVSSSGAAPYMGAYEVFKTSQVELCNTLSAELEGTDIVTYTIGPGLVKTETAQKSIEIVSSLIGMTTTEFYEMNDKHVISAEEAGVGFALSVVNARRYNGLEIGSIQVLMDARMYEKQVATPSHAATSANLEPSKETLSPHIENTVNAFIEQYNGWLQRNPFEKQWVLRDFKKKVGITADSFNKLMLGILDLVESNNYAALAEYKPSLEKLKDYYLHQHKLLQGYEKDPEKLKVNSQVILDWIDELQTVIDEL
jgi:NAD(P)-dependent dehydrogenase (short-subunit alcohol dehydrogenase family)